jgi:hypothetical protein
VAVNYVVITSLKGQASFYDGNALLPSSSPTFESYLLVALTVVFVADSHRHPEVAFIPVTDIEPCPLSLCTRTADTSPLVAALRRVHTEDAKPMTAETVV